MQNTALKTTADWRPAACIPQSIIPSELRDFLLDPGSTTQRMQHEYAAQTEVQLLAQEWRTPHDTEVAHLALSQSEQALIREVHLRCQGKVWMYARAIFPRDFFQGKNQSILSELDQRPLGKILFRDPTLQRSEYQLAEIQPQHLEYGWALQSTIKTTESSLWARRSIIKLQNKPLLLLEVFFPEFLQLKKVRA